VGVVEEEKEVTDGAENVIKADWEAGACEGGNTPPTFACCVTAADGLDDVLCMLAAGFELEKTVVWFILDADALKMDGAPKEAGVGCKTKEADPLIFKVSGVNGFKEVAESLSSTPGKRGTGTIFVMGEVGENEFEPNFEGAPNEPFVEEEPPKEYGEDVEDVLLDSVFGGS
jgi:hypothetical protein